MAERHSYATIERAVALFENGFGYKGAAALLGVPASAIREWNAGWRALGDGWLSQMDRKHSFPCDVRLACAMACVEEGETTVEAMRRFQIGNRKAVKDWSNAYRARGAAAFGEDGEGGSR